MACYPNTVHVGIGGTATATSQFAARREHRSAINFVQRRCSYGMGLSLSSAASPSSSSDSTTSSLASLVLQVVTGDRRKSPDSPNGAGSTGRGPAGRSRKSKHARRRAKRQQQKQTTTAPVTSSGINRNAKSAVISGEDTYKQFQNTGTGVRSPWSRTNIISKVGMRPSSLSPPDTDAKPQGRVSCSESQRTDRFQAGVNANTVGEFHLFRCNLGTPIVR